MRESTFRIQKTKIHVRKRGNGSWIFFKRSRRINERTKQTIFIKSNKSSLFFIEWMNAISPLSSKNEADYLNVWSFCRCYWRNISCKKAITKKAPATMRVLLTEISEENCNQNDNENHLLTMCDYNEWWKGNFLIYHSIINFCLRHAKQSHQTSNVIIYTVGLSSDTSLHVWSNKSISFSVLVQWKANRIIFFA